MNLFCIIARISEKTSKWQYMISFFNQNIVFKLILKKYYKQWINQLVNNHHKVVRELNIIFCTDDYLLELNRRFLNHDYYTDVITFDYSDISQKMEIAGDVFISIETVRSNAIMYQTSSFEEELLRVMAHGILHLIGYNDFSDEEKMMMKKQEDDAIASYYKISKPHF